PAGRARGRGLGARGHGRTAARPLRLPPEPLPRAVRPRRGRLDRDSLPVLPAPLARADRRRAECPRAAAQRPAGRRPRPAPGRARPRSRGVEARRLKRVVSEEQARRIAVRAQLLDGSATGVLETVRGLGFLQMDPIASVATPQQLVLFSRLGSYDPAELDRLLWEERQLFEYDAFIYPVEDLPLQRARMAKRRRLGKRKSDDWPREFMRTNARFRRYLLAELEQNGPLLSRDLEHELMTPGDDHRWWGRRQSRLMFDILAARGEIAVAGRVGKLRLWDL